MLQMIERTEPELLARGYREWHDDLGQFGFEGERFIIPPAIQPEFIPHPSAPLFNQGDEGIATLNDLIKELTSDNPQLTPEIIDLMRQASYVSLWFYLKVIASYAGPYEKLTDHLHIDLANFRQRQLRPGSRGAVFISRSNYKTTICTTGANAWELLRDPDLRIGLCGSTSAMAQKNMRQTQSIFEENELMRELFPEYCPERGAKGNIIAKRWNEKEMVMPNRSKQMPEPSVKPISVGSSVAGNHFDLFCVDDIISEAELNSDMASGADMIKARQWFMSNQDTLLVSPRKSRIFLSATRYAVDDAYEPLMENCKEQVGYWDEVPYEVNKNGQWSIYYRQANEDGYLIFPEVVSYEMLKNKIDTDYWGYCTQYLNNPYSSQVSEFATYDVGECSLDIRDGEIYIQYFQQGQWREIPLRSCEVTIGVDPAASEKKTSSKTSQTAILVRARDGKDNRFVIDGQVGYLDPLQAVNGIFRLYKKYVKYCKFVTVENQGPFKVFFNLLLIERKNRRLAVPLRPAPAGHADKLQKIRTIFQPIMERGQLFVTKGQFGDQLRQQLELFPGSTKLDILDAFELSERYSSKVFGGEDDEANRDFEERKREELRRYRNVGKAGY